MVAIAVLLHTLFGCCAHHAHAATESADHGWGIECPHEKASSHACGHDANRAHDHVVARPCMAASAQHGPACQCEVPDDAPHACPHQLCVWNRTEVFAADVDQLQHAFCFAELARVTDVARLARPGELHWMQHTSAARPLPLRAHLCLCVLQI
ncbi:MAG: hypothetical protein R3C10_06580 [Pirellulales bacterium]